MHEKFITFGIGGCGCTIAHKVAELTAMKAICIDTDVTSLEKKEADCQTVLLGEDRFEGLGTGGDVASARMAAVDFKPEFRKLLKSYSLAIVVTGIGGGTGSAITPTLLEVAREMSIPTMTFIVFPFSMEGSDKNKVANAAVSNITKHADIYCYFKNDDLSGSFLTSSDASLYDAMADANLHIISGITMFWRMMTKPGYINLDLSTLINSTKKGRGQFYLCKSKAYGENRTQNAINELINSHSGVLDHANETALALLGIIGGQDLRLCEIGDVVSNLSLQLTPNVPIKLGTVIEQDANGSIEIIAILFKNWVEQYESAPQKATEPQQTIGMLTNAINQTQGNAGSKPAQNQATISSKFTGTQPFIYNGENLDDPTYLRKRIPIS